jgi:hypothetical protein
MIKSYVFSGNFREFSEKRANIQKKKDFRISGNQEIKIFA